MFSPQAGIPSGRDTGEKHGPSASARRAGFTLVELLVAIALLAILASILAPVFAQAREKVRSYMCLSNLRQIGIATMLYTQDYDERYAAPDLAPFAWLPDRHQPYLKQWRVWQCPSDPDARAWDGYWNSPSFPVRTSYIWNAYVFQGDWTDWRQSIPVAAVTYPATLVTWAEGYANGGYVNDAAPLSAPVAGYAYLHNAYGDNLNAAPDDPTAGACPIHHRFHLDVAHTNGGNYIFADGHAAWLLPGKFTTDAIRQNRGYPLNDRSDPFVVNGARTAARWMVCPVFCCPRDIGTPPGDGNHPWFRP